MIIINLMHYKLQVADCCLKKKNCNVTKKKLEVHTGFIILFSGIRYFIFTVQKQQRHGKNTS